MLPLLMILLVLHGSTPLEKKSDFYPFFLKLQKPIENQFSTTVKVFQSDGGGEFPSSHFAFLILVVFYTFLFRYT